MVKKQKIKRVNFPIIIYESEDKELEKYTAHCLSLDIIFDAETMTDALCGVLELITCSIESSEKHCANMFHDAPDKYWSMFNDADNLQNKDLHKN